MCGLQKVLKSEVLSDTKTSLKAFLQYFSKQIKKNAIYIYQLLNKNLQKLTTHGYHW